MPKGSNWSLTFFIVATIIFSYLKYYSCKTDDMYAYAIGENGKGTVKECFMKSKLQFLIYFVAVVGCQIINSVQTLNDKCNGNPKNTLSAMSYAIGPWVFIFLIMVLIINFVPGFLKVFSDVIGYGLAAGYIVKTLKKLIYDSKDAEKKYTNIANSEEKTKLSLLQDILSTITKSRGEIINAFGTHSFNDLLELIEPIIKDELKEGKGEAEKDELLKDLFYGILYKDIVGEFMWYIYTGILVCSMVNLNVQTKSCIPTPKEIMEMSKQGGNSLVSTNQGPTVKPIELS
jgi:hypothetical protein